MKLKQSWKKTMEFSKAICVPRLVVAGIIFLFATTCFVVGVKIWATTPEQNYQLFPTENDLL